jgi:chloramphenicol-sensitive protein RarD
MFLLAVLLYNEPLALDKLVTFIIIWAALAIYSYDAVRTHQQVRRAAKLQ